MTKQGENKASDQEEGKKAVEVTATTEEGGKQKEATGKKGKNKNNKKEKDELSEEDKALKEGLELAVTRLQEMDPSMHAQALEHLVREIKTSTSSMTSVPKPLKFLHPHYNTIKTIYESWSLDYPLKQSLADTLSVLAMTMAPVGSRESLKFKLQGTQTNISSWGHEYVRSLAGEVSEEYNRRSLEAPPGEDDADVDDLLALVDDIVPFQMNHNAEAEAVDLLMEVQRLHKLTEPNVVEARNHERVCLYLLRCADFMADPDDLATLFLTAYTIYKKQNKFTDALRVAIKIRDFEKIDELFADDSGASDVEKKQMSLILGRHRSSYTHSNETYNDLIGNVGLSDRFLATGLAMDVLEAKTPENIYKTHLAEGVAARGNGRQAATVDSARNNLASSLVSGFVNAGFGTDKLLTEDNGNWVFKNKDHGMLTAVASLGLVHLWNIDQGLNQIDKYFHHPDDYIKAGACLAVGILSSGVRNESDPALALLSEYLESPSSHIRTQAICGLGIAYAGTQKEELVELLLPIVQHTELHYITEVSLAALALGMIFEGSCHDDIATTLLQRLMEASAEELNHTASRFLCLGLGLLYLGRSENADVIIEALRTVEHSRGKYAELTLDTCAHCGTGDVLKIQQLLKICSEHLTEKAEHQAVAVLGIALTAVGEDIGTEMSLRVFEHLLHYGELPVRRVVPLAFALLYTSNPDYGIIDQLSRLSHDQDALIAQSAILAIGIVSAGSNNSRVAGLLRQLSDFFAREADHLFAVRLAQGLNAMGKGLVGLTPFHSDRLLMSGASMAGLLTVLHACLDLKATVLDKYHFLLLFLVPAMSPRSLVTLDSASLAPLPVTVRVGLAVETVGQAGRPKTITGFQTHQTPVLLGVRDRAELAGQEWVSVSSVVEGVVLVEKAPETPDNNNSSSTNAVVAGNSNSAGKA